MITAVGSNTYEFRGLSTDTKPTDDRIGNGSLFFEMDTLKIYYFDGATKTWEECVTAKE